VHRRSSERAGWVERRALAWLASLAWLACSAAVARADEVRVQVEADACPSAALLEQKLAPLLPGVTLAFAAPSSSPSSSPPSPAQSVSVSDLGERYAIEVAGLSREVQDPARDCVERARVAAVFIALNLAQKPEPEPAPQPAPPAESAPPPEPTDEPQEPPGLQLGLRVFGDGAYALAPERGALGGGLGAWLGHGAWRVALDVGVLSPVRVSFAPADGAVSVLRLPVVASAGFRLRVGRLELGPSVGLALDVLHLRGVEVLRPQSQLRFDPGLSVAAEAGLRLAPALVVGLRVHAEALARAYALRVDPLGPLAHTPRLWLGASLGLDWQLR